MSELKVKHIRNEFSDKTTISDVLINGEFLHYCLEDKDRGLNNLMTLEATNKIKIHSQTAIGYTMPGTLYVVDITLSNRFGIHYPIVLGVVGFTGIREHCGVSCADTEGCQLHGVKKIKDGLQQSAIAFYNLFEKYLFHKTEDAAVTKTLIGIHQAHRAFKIASLKANNAVRLADLKDEMKQNSDAFTKLYEEKKIATNTISLEIIKATENVITR